MSSSITGPEPTPEPEPTPDYEPATEPATGSASGSNGAQEGGRRRRKMSAKRLKKFCKSKKNHKSKKCRTMGGRRRKSGRKH